MKVKWKAVMALALVCASCVGILCGCQKAKADSEYPAIASPDDYADCPKHDVAHFEFYTPDTITLVREGVIIGVYAKGTSVYEAILEMNEEALQTSLADYMARTGQTKAGLTQGIVGDVIETEDGLVGGLMVYGIYLVYEYVDHAYPPVYFCLRNPLDNSTVSAAQPKNSDESSGPYGFTGSQELLDYLNSL